jgi:glycogen debranching enzyme
MYLFPSASTASTRDLTWAWCGPSLLIVEADGSTGGHPLGGYYFRQTRYLKDVRLHVRGATPHACSVAEVAPNEMELTHLHPEVERGGGGGSGSGGQGSHDGVLFRGVDLRVRYVVHPASADILLYVTNRWQEDVEIELGWALGADFAAVDEACFGYREQAAAVHARVADERLELVYDQPELPLRTEIRAHGRAAWRFHAGGVTATLALPRQHTVEMGLIVSAIDPLDPIDVVGESARESKLLRWRGRLAHLHAPAETPLVEIANRGCADVGSLALLEGPPDEWLTPGAGVPLYASLWGRDALTAAWQSALWDRGEMLEDVLACLDRLQARRVDDARDEQPGRIINQVKWDPLARLGLSGFDRHYADVASPFMFVIGLGYHHTLTADEAHLRRRWDAALRAMDWAERVADEVGGGYVAYRTRSPAGPRHQAWKDSDNAVVDEDGRQIEPPIAACEIQGYWYVAMQFMAALAAWLGEPERGLTFWKRAAALKKRFNRDFWMEDLGFLAFGLGGDGRPIRALTSNAGQCLPTGIVDAEHVPRLVRRMFEPDMFSGWGIRTLSSSNPAYHPLDYHLGSVWPVENATIAFGLRRYGLNERTVELVRALYDLARLWPGGRTPECVGGYARDEAAHPGCYPRANRPQLWNQSVWPLLVQSLLGIVPYAPARLLLVDPILPEWLPELSLKRLRVGDATVSLRFRRERDGGSSYEVTDRQGTLRVVRQPWLESFTTKMWDRAADLEESAVVALTGRMS